MKKLRYACLLILLCFFSFSITMFISCTTGFNTSGSNISTTQSSSSIFESENSSLSQGEQSSTSSASKDEESSNSSNELTSSSTSQTTSSSSHSGVTSSGDTSNPETIVYNIIYNAHGGEGTAMVSSTHTYDVAKNLTANTYTKVGYTFAGWATSANGEVVYADSESVTNLSSTNGATIELFAKWDIIELNFVINFTHGTDIATLKVDGNSYTESTTIKVPYGTVMTVGTDSSEGKLTFTNEEVGFTKTVILTVTPKTGCTAIARFCTANDTNSATVTDGIITTETDIYARAARPANVYTVAYNANGGSGTTMTSSTHTYDTAKALTANTYTKTYYTFGGWNTKADGTGTNYSNKASVKNLASTNGAIITLYAQWVEEVVNNSSNTNPLQAGTLLYYENFEGRTVSTSTSAVMSQLGWTYTQGTSSNTANFYIADYNGSRMLQINNYDGTTAGANSFVTILSETQMKYLHTYNYTYQWDMVYTSAEKTSNYFGLISEYNGTAYNNFMFKNGGAYNNEVCGLGAVTRWDIAVSGANSRSLLLGTQAPSSFNNISVSIRYVVDWENGCKVYARVNTAGYPTSGYWTLISAYDDAGNSTNANVNADEYLNVNKLGSAIGLKIGGGQNGYIDNIAIWAGTVNEPSNKTSPYMTSTTTCHKYQTVNGIETCMLCGKTRTEINAGWLLSNAPAFECNKEYSTEAYLTGQGLDASMPLSKESKMQVISNTTLAMFEDYQNRLYNEGYILEYSRHLDNNVFRSYIKGSVRIYVYYIDATKETRVIEEDATYCSSLNEFGYTYTPKSTDTTVIYQYALSMRDSCHTKADGYVDNGMLYMIKLADNSLILIDGGGRQQFTDSAVDELMAFLREISGVGSNGKIKISAWYLTHAHGDHLQGFGKLLNKYGASYISVDRVIYNLPSTHSSNTTITGNNGQLKKIVGYINTYNLNSNPIFLKAHTGQVVQIGNVKLDFIYSHEDLVDPLTGVTEVGTNYNEASLVCKFTIDDKTFMLLGDIDVLGANILMQNWSASTLKSDMVQIAHHVLNDVSALYNVIQATVVFVPQSLDRINEIINSTSDTRNTGVKAVYDAYTKYASAEWRFYQNEKTVGISVQNGSVKKVYEKVITYCVETSTTW